MHPVHELINLAVDISSSAKFPPEDKIIRIGLPRRVGKTTGLNEFISNNSCWVIDKGFTNEFCLRGRQFNGLKAQYIVADEPITLMGNFQEILQDTVHYLLSCNAIRKDYRIILIR